MRRHLADVAVCEARLRFEYQTHLFMIDILYLTHNRREFTEHSLAALGNNTNWDLVRYVYFYDDQSTDGTQHLLGVVRATRNIIPSRESMWDGDELRAAVISRPLGGPVAIMNHYLSQPGGADIFAKIDNDVILPPGWLDQSLEVMRKFPELDLLGIEPPASRTPAPWRNGGAKVEIPEYRQDLNHVGYARCDAIGGIGLMRRSAFAGRPPMQPYGPNGVGGFTDWQLRFADVCKGWICPPLKVFLLDRLPFEPWASLSKKYIAEGIQRPWTNYPEGAASELWDWWGKP